MSSLKVHKLYLYPFKSLQGMEVSEIHFDDLGIVDDRRFVLVDENYKFLTQRETPDLAKFRVERSLKGFKVFFENDHVEIDNGGEHFPLHEIQVWNHKGPAFNMGVEASQFFSKYLGQKIFVFKISPSFNRKNSTETSLISFVDSRQLLLCNQGSLTWLNQELKNINEEAITLDRFRANIILDEAAFVEESFNQMNGKEFTLEVEKKCGRCVVVTTDQQTGARKSTAVLKILAKRNKEVSFGVYFTIKSHKNGALLRVGDVLQGQ